MIKIENLTKIYKSKKKNNCKALDGINFTLPDKGLIYIIGKSGSGKSTLLNLLGGLDSITTGSINVHGFDLSTASESDLYSYRSNNVGFIFQDFHLLDDLTVEENIKFSLKLLNVENDELINQALKEVDLEGYNNRYPNELSGGEKQRVAIARALVKNPEIILADEPTGNLDSKTTKMITELIKKISNDKLVVIVSHNLYDAYEYADRIIELSYGKIINDISKNEEYDNEISIKDDTLYLPLLKKFDKEELDNIYDTVSNKLVANIQQKEDKFIDTKEVKSSNKELIKHTNNLKIKDSIKFSYLFGKTRIIRFILSSFMVAMMVVVLFLGQSISYFKPSDVIGDLIAENDENSSFGVKKTLDAFKGESAIKHITDEDIKQIREYGYNGNIYELYNITFPLSYYYTLSEGTYQNGKLYSQFPNETSGVLVTNQEYVKKILDLDELEIYTNNTPYNPGGFYITDYIADGILNAKSLSTFYSHVKTYDDMLGQFTVTGTEAYIDGYINGIIKTNYKEKYGDIMNYIKDSIFTGKIEIEEDVIDYYDEVINSYAMQFSFEEDFIEYYLSSISTRNYTQIWSADINGVNLINKRTNHYPASLYEIKLGENEIAMSMVLYNSLFKTNYTNDTIDEFVPHACTLTIDVTPDKDRTNEMEVTISKLITNHNSFFCSEDIFLKNKETFTSRYALYFDGDYSVIFDELINDSEYTIMSNRMTSVSTMTKAVAVFNDFFSLITTILVSAIMFLLISFGVKNVNNKIYEIGVMKALGCKQSRFSIIFGIHTLFISILVCLMTILGVWLTYDFANTILVKSINAFAPSYALMDLQFIRFNWIYILQDSILVLVVAVISTLVSIIRLNKIKPISIIKAKE